MTTTMMNAGMYSSATDEWETPQHIFDWLNEEFHFTLDVCATAANAKTPHYLTREQNGLAWSWYGHICWMNPPYGRDIAKWVRKAYEEAVMDRATTVCLLPSRTDTAWWHDYCMRSNDIRFLRGRLKFGGAKWNAPFPSVIVVFRPKRLTAGQ